MSASRTRKIRLAHRLLPATTHASRRQRAVTAAALRHVFERKFVATWLPRRRGIRWNATVRDGLSRQQPFATELGVFTSEYLTSTRHDTVFSEAQSLGSNPSGRAQEFQSLARLHLPAAWKVLVASSASVPGKVRVHLDVHVAVAVMSLATAWIDTMPADTEATCPLSSTVAIESSLLLSSASPLGQVRV